MSYAIKVKLDPDENCPWIFEKELTKPEFDTVKQHCTSQRTFSFFESTVITVRTDTLANFCKDFFLPTFVNYALQANNIALKILTAPICLGIDLLTLLIRVITLPFRYHYNSQNPKEIHPLHKYLSEQKAPASVLTANSIYLSLSEHPQDPRKERTEETTLHFIQVHSTAYHHRLMSSG